MYPRRFLPLSWSDLTTGLISCFRPLKRAQIEDEIKSWWSAEENMCVCLSVRTGLDLVLTALDFPEGTEILMSAVNIPGIVEVVKAHGLVPVPLDLDLETLAIKRGEIENAVTPRTKLILVAPLFGSLMDMSPIVSAAKRHNLFVVEDCAQAFRGNEFQGDPQSDAVMFSFGPIKTCSALGGAVMKIKDQELLRKVCKLEASYPEKGRVFFLKRVFKFCLLKFVSHPLLYGIFVGALRLVRIDYDKFIGQQVRGFGKRNMLQLIKFRPPVPMLELLRLKLKFSNPEGILARIKFGMRAREMLKGAVKIPGAEALAHTYWVFPVCANNPADIVAILRNKGFDATQGASSMCVVDAPADRPQCRADNAAELIAKVVYLPIYPELSERKLAEMASLLKHRAQERYLYSDLLQHKPVTCADNNGPAK